MRRFALTFGGILALAIVLWVAVGFASAQRACAHDPRFACSPRSANDPISIADPTKSWAFYGHLHGNQTDHYAIALDHAASIPWSLLVDERDAANPARPFAMLYSEDGSLIKRLDFSRSERFYEPFSRENYVTTPALNVDLKKGAYRISVSMANGSALQRYTMAFGSEERFTLGGIPLVFGSIHRIRALNY